MLNETPKVVLVTGGAQRIGATIVKRLHQAGMNIVIHYNHSSNQAQELATQLNRLRQNSVFLIQGDLLDEESYPKLITATLEPWGRLDFLINNASSYFKTPFGTVNAAQWDDLLGTNMKAPFFLAQAAKDPLAKHQGAIVNIIDIHSLKPLKDYSVYCIAKAALLTITKVLAKELAPQIRVNGVSPGPILWPTGENTLAPEVQEKIISQVLLQRPGDPQDIAEAVFFLLSQNYITGQILAIDGGRSVNY